MKGLLPIGHKLNDVIDRQCAMHSGSCSNRHRMTSLSVWSNEVGFQATYIAK